MEQPPPIPNLPSESDNPAPMSLPARLLNVFAIPGAVFQDIRDAVRLQPGSWLVPILLAAMVIGTSFGMTISRPAVLGELRTRQTAAVDELVKSGKMKQAEADANIRMIERLCQPRVVQVLAGVAGLAISTLRVLWWTFALWLLALAFLKVRIGWWKAAEAAGLASMVSVLGSVVTALLTADIRTDATMNFEAMMKQFEAQNKSVVMILLANGFNIWFVTLLASGLSRLANVRLSRTLLLVMGTWLALQLSFGFLVAGLGFLR